MRTCHLEDHLNKPITWICSNPTCQNNRLLCSRCLVALHHDCQEHTLEIEDVYHRNLADNVNWIKGTETKRAFYLIKKRKLNDANQIFGIFKSLITEEFAKLADYVVQKIDETRDKVLKEVEEKYSYE